MLIFVVIDVLFSFDLILYSYFNYIDIFLKVIVWLYDCEDLFLR